MFQDRTLNWSFAASICANVILVSLLGGSDLLKTTPGRILPPMRRLPFIVFAPTAPPVTPSVVKPQPVAAHVKPVVHRETHPATRAVSLTHPAAHPAARPTQVARLDGGSRHHRFGNVAIDNGAQPVGDQTDADSAGTAAGSVVPTKIVHTEDYPPQPVGTEGTRTTQATQATPPVPDVSKPTRKIGLADRVDPEQIGAWTDISTSVQFDQATLISSTIIVQFEVGADGRASHIKVIKSSGNSDLDQNAIDACEEMRWRPAVQDGVARSVTMTHAFEVIS